MKNDNDIKEQIIINQVKQDMMIDHERKRKLQKEDAKNEREMQVIEHDLALEQKQVESFSSEPIKQKASYEMAIDQTAIAKQIED